MDSAADGAVFRAGFFAAARTLTDGEGTRLETVPVLAALAILGFVFDVVDFVMMLSFIFILNNYFIGFNA
jgi:hypothetical protein